MTTPDKIDERTTLAELALLLNAFGVMLTVNTVQTGAAAREATISDTAGVIGSADGATLAEAIRFAFTDYVLHRWEEDRANASPDFAREIHGRIIERCDATGKHGRCELQAAHEGRHRIGLRRWEP